MSSKLNTDEYETTQLSIGADAAVRRRLSTEFVGSVNGASATFNVGRTRIVELIMKSEKIETKKCLGSFSRTWALSQANLTRVRGSRAQWLATLLPDPAAMGSRLGVPKKNSEEIFMLQRLINRII